MKFKCKCGGEIRDQSDCLPHKGYIIPDEDLFGVFDGLEHMLEAVASQKKLTPETATDVRRAFPRMRQIYQCHDCGRIFVWDKQIKGLFSFKPEDEDVNKELLRGKDGNAEPANPT